jgi:hypothetical protein
MCIFIMLSLGYCYVATALQHVRKLLREQVFLFLAMVTSQPIGTLSMVPPRYWFRTTLEFAILPPL